MFRDLGECVDHLLDLAWEDVEALDEHHVLLAVGDEHEAVLVEVADVARVDEAVADGLRGLLRPEDVAATGAARAKHFGDARPGSATIIVKALVAPEWLIEIEAVAAAKA